MKKFISSGLAAAMLLMLISCGAAGSGSVQGTDAQKQEDQSGVTVETDSQTGGSRIPETESAAGTADEQSDTDYTTGTPWQDIDLEGVVTEDTPTDLKDNFALAANKDKILGFTIPKGYPYGGTIMDVVLKNSEDLKNMFLDHTAESHDAKLALTLYDLMMDWDGRNALGVTPLKEQTDAVEALDSIEALSAYLGELPPEDQLASLWNAGMDTDLTDSNKYILGVGTPDLLLDDSAEYETLTDYGKIKKEAIEELARKMLVKLGYSEEDAATKINNCLTFETMLAPSICTYEETQKPDYLAKTNNHYSREEFIAEIKNLPILSFLEKSAGFPEADDYVVYEPDFIAKLNELYTDENLALLKDYIIVHGTIAGAASLDRECYEWYTDASNAVSGATGILDDATVFSGAVADTLSWPVAQLYTESYLKEEDKDRISLMIDEILEAYHGILEGADFLSDETKTKAIKKLEAIHKNVLYPDSWDKYSYEELNLTPAEEGGSLWEAIKQISAYNTAEEVKDYQGPVDKEKWLQEPQVVNCFYYPATNAIYILGGMAQGNIYNSDMSDEELYAKLGTIIGHEISHAFDSTGSQFDKDGNMVNWWAEEDQEAFLAKNEKMAAYFNAMHPWEGQDFYGSIMTGEACADMAGIKCMLLIAAEKEDFDYDIFFRSYADLWATKDSLQRAYLLINNPHPMNYLRINTSLQQYDEFLDFYGITEGDGMYLAPEDRVAIW